MDTVLLTNGQQRKTLAAARALCGEAKVIVAEDTALNPSAFSRCCSRFVRSPNAGKEPEKYFAWLTETIEKYRPAALFPMDDDTMDIAVAHAGELSRLCLVPVPPKESYLIARSKAHSLELAKYCGLDCPKTAEISSLSQLKGALEKVGLPAVIKPKESSGSRGIRLVKDCRELCSEYVKLRGAYGWPLVQEYVGQGTRYDVCLLVDGGKILASFVQKELRHFPMAMGPSTVQQSVDCPELVELASAVVRKLPWFGVMEFEFIMGDDSRPRFMEINPRFWASLHTAVLSGVNFPLLLLKLLKGEKFEPVVNYTSGVTVRWLLPGDLLHFAADPKRFAMDPPFFAGRGVKDDIASLRDPLPVLGFTLAAMKYSVDRNMWKFFFRR